MNYIIAIVEDNHAEANLLESYFNRFAAACHDTFQVTRFPDGQAFLDGYKPIYDLVMMDVNLPKKNGMDAAICLRQIDQSVALIFVTSMAQYAVRGYEVDAIDFLIKPVTYLNFMLKIKRVLRRLQHNNTPQIIIPLTDGIYRISASRIKYIEVINHSLIYHTTEGDISSRGKMADMEGQLSKTQFVRCNRCYLVNLAFVRTVRGYTLVVDKDELQISRPKRQAVLETLNNYLGGEV